MGLILKLHLDTNPDVYVGDNRYFLVDTVPRAHVVLRRESDGETFTLTTDKETELEPDVWACVGRRPDDYVSWTGRAAKVDFDAPRRIKIDLGSALRRRAAA